MVSGERMADFDAAIRPRERLLRLGVYSMTGESETGAEGDRIGDAALGYAWHGWPIAPGGRLLAPSSPRGFAGHRICHGRLHLPGHDLQIPTGSPRSRCMV
jgi:hypothetical protein